MDQQDWLALPGSPNIPDLNLCSSREMMLEIEQGYTVYPNRFLNRWLEEFSHDQYRVMTYLWKQANHDGRDFTNYRDKPIQIQRGQVYASVRSIAGAVGVGKSVVQTLLKSQRFKTYASTNVRHGATLISFHHYMSYARPGSYRRTKSSTTSGPNQVQDRDFKKASLTEKPNENALPLHNYGAESGKERRANEICRIAEKVRAGRKLSPYEQNLFNDYAQVRRLCPKSDREVIPEMESVMEENGLQSYEDLHQRGGEN
jgi:hypothetical protein